MAKPPKMKLHHPFPNRRQSNFLSNAFTPNPIMSNVSTHPQYHSRPSNIELKLLLALYHEALNLKQHDKSYNRVVKVSVQLEQDFQFQSQITP